MKDHPQRKRAYKTNPIEVKAQEEIFIGNEKEYIQFKLFKEEGEYQWYHFIPWFDECWIKSISLPKIGRYKTVNEAKEGLKLHYQKTPWHIIIDDRYDKKLRKPKSNDTRRN